MSCLCEEHSIQEDHFLEEFKTMKYLIILNKIRYYYPEKANGKEPIHDFQYDQFETRYLQLCLELNKPNTLVHKIYPEFPEEINGKGMMEVDFNDPDVQLVMDDIARNRIFRNEEKMSI